MLAFLAMAYISDPDPGLVNFPTEDEIVTIWGFAGYTQSCFIIFVSFPPQPFKDIKPVDCM